MHDDGLTRLEREAAQRGAPTRHRSPDHVRDRRLSGAYDEATFVLHPLEYARQRSCEPDRHGSCRLVQQPLERGVTQGQLAETRHGLLLCEARLELVARLE